MQHVKIELTDGKWIKDIDYMYKLLKKTLRPVYNNVVLRGMTIKVEAEDNLIDPYIISKVIDTLGLEVFLHVENYSGLIGKLRSVLNDGYTTVDKRNIEILKMLRRKAVKLPILRKAENIVHLRWNLWQYHDVANIVEDIVYMLWRAGYTTYVYINPIDKKHDRYITATLELSRARIKLYVSRFEFPETVESIYTRVFPHIKEIESIYSR